MLVYIFLKDETENCMKRRKSSLGLLFFLNGRLCDDVKLQSGKGYGRLARRDATPTKLMID